MDHNNKRKADASSSTPSKEADAQDGVQRAVAPAQTDAAGAPEDFREQLIELIPFLRAFARSLCNNRESANDLAQEALAKAWQSRHKFQPGTNLRAWLFTIMRNQFYSEHRRSWRQTPLNEDNERHVPSVNEPQTWKLELSDTARALQALPPTQREALILVSAGDLSYEETAEICKCAVGTVKSRVARARAALVAALDGQDRLSNREDVNVDAANQIMAELSRLTSAAKK